MIKHIAALSSLPDEISYVGKDGLQAIKSMALVNRGRLSESTFPSQSVSQIDHNLGVQPVTEDAYEAVVMLGTRGGWEDLVSKKASKPKQAEQTDTLKKVEHTDTPQKKPKSENKKRPSKSKEDPQEEVPVSRRNSKRIKN